MIQSVETACEQENESHIAIWSIDYNKSWIVCFTKKTPYVKI